MKSEGKNLVKNLIGNRIFEIAERRNNLKVEKVGRKSSVNRNHTDLILNWNIKKSDSINVHPNHTNSNQLIPDNSTNIGSINYSANILAIEKILVSPVYSLVYASPIFTYGSASDPPSLPHDSSAESMTHKGNTTARTKF